MAEEQPVAPPATLRVPDTSAPGESLPDSRSHAYTPTADGRPFAVPGYELLDTLGQGGMGVVYRARHLKLGRFAAVKLLLNAEQAGADALARFVTEARVVAHARHPHVVEVYDYGDVHGTPYLVMELLPGGSLAAWMKGRAGIDVGEAVGLVKKVARAVAAVHAKGVVHRDLKPGNVLFDEHGQPKVTDFGLAKEADSELTRTNALMGTPHYMPPEQARGQAKTLGPTADVWSLGVILYECLTGVRPFTGNSAFDVMAHIVGEEPAAVRGRNPAVPADLAAVVETCLRKDAAGRYPTAAELAAALDRVSLEPVTPSRAPTPSRGRWVLPVAVVALLAAAGLVATLWPKRDANPPAASATPAPADPTPAPPVPSPLDTPELREERRKLTEAIQKKASEAPPPKPGEQAKPPASKLWTPFTQAKQTILKGHAAKVNFAMFSPDGSRVVTAGEDKTARVWDAATGAEVLTLKGHTFGVYTAAFSPDGTRIVTASYDGSAKLWDAKTGAELPDFQKVDGGSIYSALFNSDGTRIVATVSTGDAPQVLTANTGRELVTLKGHERPVDFAAFSPDDSRVVTASDDKTARVWDAKTGGLLFTFKRHTDWVKTARFSPDGTRIVTASWDTTAKVWDAKTGAEQLTLKCGDRLVHCAAFNSDGSLIVTAGGDYLARVWDAATGKEVLKLEGHGFTVMSAAFSPDGRRIVTAGDDGTARIWTAD